jgi:hypothetical protein
MSEQQSTRGPRRVIDEPRYRRHKRKKRLRDFSRRAGRWALWVFLYGVAAVLIWTTLQRIGAPPP